MSNQAIRIAYDVIVVGGGMGGLTAGALLAKEGKQVPVVEQEEHPGNTIDLAKELNHVMVAGI